MKHIIIIIIHLQIQIGRLASNHQRLSQGKLYGFYFHFHTSNIIFMLIITSQRHSADHIHFSNVP